MMTWLFGKKTAPSTEKGKDDFVSLSSHELRSPLSIIKWYTEMLLDGDAGPLTEDQRKYLTVIESSNQRAIDLVRSLLNVSRLDLGTFSISPEDVSVPETVTEVIALFAKEIERKKLRIIRQDEDSLSHLQADKHLLTVILKNVISNAISFSKEGGEVVITVAHVEAHTIIDEEKIDAESVVVTVKDQGIGIPQQDLSRIFSKMFKASNVNDVESTGSGLGLYITKSILDYIEGKIWFTSKEAAGTTFYVTLPMSGMKEKKGRTTID